MASAVAPKAFQNIHADGKAVIARVKRDRMGFCDEQEVAAIASDPATRLQPMLVRCGGCRFICAAQDVRHLCIIIGEHGGDYVRDVSIPAVGY